MRKIFVGLLSAVCLICLGLATACTKEPEYFTLIYAEQAGITYDFGDIQSGAEVKSGYEVRFTVEFDEALEGDEPQVMANETKLTADENGVYSFKMTEDTSVSVIGVFMPDDYDVLFDAGNAASGSDYREYRVWYYDLEGNDLTGLENLSYGGGETISFTMKVSVYYGDSDYRVTANSLILEPVDGVYTFTVIGDTTVSVEGLEEDIGFANRENGGSGTHDDPYRIEKPIDLYYMADLVGDSFYSGRFALASYRLEADIDMQGEQLYVIGDMPTDDSISMFCGEFDGNGHTISNYIIRDTIVEQESFTDVPLRYIGLFGYAFATYSSPVNIYDLTLENFEIQINGAKYPTSGFYAGGIVGYGTGVNITNCKVSGKISADGNTDYFSQVGGVIGYLQSAYGTEVFYHSGITNTQSDVEIECAIGNVYTAGGIVGMLSSSAETVNSYVLNSFATGSISGAICTGGIAGYMGPYTSVVNSYASGTDIYSRSDVGIIQGNDIYAYTYAGGIAGFAGNDTVIANSFSVVDEVYAHSSLGSRYESAGALVGGFDADGESYVQSKALISSNNYTSSDNVTFNETFFKTTLGWNESDWNFDGTYPVLKDGNASVRYTITVKYNDTTVEEFEIDSYNLMSHWYLNGMSDYITDGRGYRSYGYFFDKEKTLSVPNAFIPTGNITIYVDYADYSKVAGTYYLRTGNGEEAYFLLDVDGTLIYRYGALNYETTYTYDGTKIVLQRNPAFTETVSTGNGETSVFYICAMAQAGDDTSTLSFYDRVNYTEEQPLLTVKEIDGFTYGGYYASDNSADYTFYKDGTGVAGSTSFTYTLSEGVLKINLPSGSVSVTLSGGSFGIDGVTYTAYDQFRGVWEKSAKAHEQYYFDGKGNWTYSFTAYNADGTTSEVTETQSGTYERRNDSIILSNGTLVGYDTVNKWLTIADVPYYKENSLVGEWRFFNFYEAVTLIFNGIGADGYGLVTASYGTGERSYELNYEVTVTESGTVVTIMDGATAFGELVYSVRESTLTGAVYLATSGIVTPNALFCLYDDFRGIWISEIGTVEFNGLGKYDIMGTANYTKTEGTVKVDGKNAGKYTVDGSGVRGTFSYGGTVYNIYYNGTTGEVEVTTSDEHEFKLIKADELYGLTFVSGDGTLYNFNGGGNLATGGVMLVDGEDENYTYFNENGVITIKKNGETCGSIINESGVYKFTLNGEQDVLVINNEFTGTWHKGGVDSGTVVIGVINGDKTASGSYLGTDVTFRYDVDGGYLSFEYNNEILYILSMHATRIELAVSREPKKLDFEVCIKDSDIDTLIGEYRNADGSVMTFDGLSTSIYAGGGTAVLRDEDGKLVATYKYKVNAIREIELAGDIVYVFEEVAAGTDGSFTGNGHSYVITETDYFYSRTGVEASGVTYRFDGHGTVKTNNGRTFTYEIVSYDEILYEYTLTLKDGDKTYEAIYSRIVGDFNMVVSPDYMENVSATAEDGTTYTFDGAGKATDSEGRSYTYTVDVYSATNGTYTLTLVLEAEEGSTQYEAVYTVATGSISVTEKEAAEE